MCLWWQEEAKRQLQELFTGLPDGVRALLVRELVDVEVNPATSPSGRASCLEARRDAHDANGLLDTLGTSTCIRRASHRLLIDWN